jgi:hypothetical protein
MSMTFEMRRSWLVMAGVSAALLAPLAATWPWISTAVAQEKALATIEEDVQAFAIAPDNSIAFATQRIKRIKKAYVEHDDFWMGDTEGHHKKIIDGDKFNPTDAQLSYQVESLTWSPDSKRLIVKMDTSEIAQPQGTVVMQMDTQQTVRPNTVLYLMDREGREIPIKGAKDRTIEGAYNGAWSGDSTTLLYMTKPSGTFGEITTMRPEEGTTKKLFEGITFRALVWDTPRNHAFAIMESLKTLGVPKMVQLDLKDQTIRELFNVDAFQGYLSVSPSGNKLGYFRDGDTLEVHDLTNKQKPATIRVAIGEFDWAKDEQSVLLKRGDPQQSGDLLWVGVYSGRFDPFFHSLVFHAFQVAPDGATVAVTQPGRRALVIYPLAK